MKKEPKEYHKGFVQTAIDNATQMITLTDAKVGALIALYSLIIAGIIEVRENISDALVAAYNYSTFFFFDNIDFMCYLFDIVVHFSNICY